MVNNNKRLFKLLFFPISLLLCLSIFLLTSFAYPGYEIENNGNIKSLNFLDYSHRLSNKALDNNGNIVDNAYGAYVIDDIPLRSNTTYSCDISNGGGLAQFDSSMNFISMIDLVNNHTFTTSINARYFRMDATPSNHSPMMNEGTSVLDYFPFGYYFNNAVNQTYSIYNIFNGVTVWLSNLTSDGAIIEEVFSLDVNQTSITFNDLPTIRSYILNHMDFEPFTLSIYFGPSNPQSASYIITLNSYDWQPTIKLSGFSDKVFNRSNNSNTYIINTFNDTYSSLSIIDFESSYDVVNSFRLSLVQADTSYYNNGYSNGYSDGLSDGENIGFNSGYQSGYNTGTTTNIETNGIRTLFNSILSFPVDMIKSVFNFEFMGVNVASVIMFIVSIGIVAFVLKKFL